MNKIRDLKIEISQLKEDLKSVDTTLENSNSDIYDIQFINAILDKCLNIKNESIENKQSTLIIICGFI